MSQPTLSGQMRLLEEKYGVELFSRVGRGIQLTPTGRRLLALVGQINSIEADAVQFLKDEGEMRSGTLRVGAVSPYHITDVLAGFSQKYPAMTVQARFGNSESVLRELLDFRIDVAMVANKANNPKLHAMPFRRDPIVALVPRTHALGRRRTIRIEELNGERMVVREPGSTARQVIDAALLRSRVKPDVVMELGSREAIREAVAKGIGIGTLSAAAISPDPRLTILKFSNVDVATVTYLLCLKTRRQARPIDAFFAIAETMADRSFSANARTR